MVPEEIKEKYLLFDEESGKQEDFEELICSICLMSVVLSPTKEEEVKVYEVHFGCLGKWFSKAVTAEKATTVPSDEEQLNSEYYETPCHHPFHASCLKAWLPTAHRCPTCRQELPKLI